MICIQFQPLNLTVLDEGGGPKTSSSGHFDIRKLYLISFEECVFFCKKKVATKYYNHLVISSVNAMKPATKGHMSDNLW